MVRAPKAPQRFPKMCTECEWCQAIWILIEALTRTVTVEERDKSSIEGGAGGNGLRRS